MTDTVRDLDAAVAPRSIVARPAPWTEPALLRAVGAFLLGCYAVGLPSYVWLRGVPFEREQVLVLLLVAVVGVVLVRGGSLTDVRRAARDWAVFGLLFAAYDLTRGVSDTLGMPVLEAVPIEIDKMLFGAVPTVELQNRLGPFSGERWWEGLISITYVSHFIVPYVLTAVLWVRKRATWRAWIVQFSTLTVAGLATYILAPTKPPWLASQDGLLPPLERTAARGWRRFDLEIAERLVDKGQVGDVVNLVAALPSLHAAYALLFSVFLWRRVGWYWRPALAAYPLVMAFGLVISGEHYVFDVLVGWFYVVAVVVLWHRVSRRPDVADWVRS
ncbi:MAG: inositol phosphorylceramide synthase [Acidimicrobiales bacterium]|nr:inositol phosphorylceramide synthase [Acidimicrobiales bacterium]